MTSRLVARIRILPAEADSDLDDLILGLKTKIPEDIKLKAHAKEPIAFGLNAVVGDFLIDDDEGQMDKLEDSIKKIEGVGEIEVINVSRQSVKIK
ncbi:MAG TPA: elongation factor 1-beta [Nitrososphaeraceae archaeon]|jgi:elongation factor 1-beta|nr:elongation factor 1-beta [Nitrososphaeraceae archaeon]